MHNILFDSYRKYQKDNNHIVVKKIFKLPIGIILLVSALVISLICNMLAVSVPFFKNTYFVYLILEAILCISIYFYTESFQIKNSDIRLSEYQVYCDKIKGWLDQTGFLVTKENLIELVSRLTKEIELEEKRRNSIKEYIGKWVQVLIVPVLLAVFSVTIKEHIVSAELYAYVINFLIFIVTIGISIQSCYNLFGFYRKHKLEQLKRFVCDLQGVIDCQFDDKLFAQTN